MHFLLQIIVIGLVFTISHELKAIAAAVVVPPYTSAVAPINKHTDAAKPLFSVKIITGVNIYMQYLNANFLIDLDAPFIWHDCYVPWNIFPGSCPASIQCTFPVACDVYPCTDMRTTYSYQNPSCPPVTNASLRFDYCACQVNVVNPITGSCSQTLTGYDKLTLNTSDGRNVFTGLYDAFPNSACVSSSSFESFPATVTGVMALSSSPYALPAYLHDPQSSLKRTISLCLPSTLSSPGVLFYGDGPYYLLPQSNVDIRSFLSYTPLVKHPDSFGYFIRVNTIEIKTRSVNIPANTTTTKISTLEPYTVLRTDIYNPVVRRFSKVTKRIPPAKPVAPFSLCFNTSKYGTTQVGLKVPNIDFGLPGGKKWSIATANSIKQVTKDVACLAFVDGGATSEPAIIIGTFQFEDNFLLFDLENSKFGFSSSLLRKHMSCANFNSTLVNN